MLPSSSTTAMDTNEAVSNAVKHAFHGREAGTYGLEEFLEYKSLQLKA